MSTTPTTTTTVTPLPTSMPSTATATTGDAAVHATSSPVATTTESTTNNNNNNNTTNENQQTSSNSNDVNTPTTDDTTNNNGNNNNSNSNNRKRVRLSTLTPSDEDDNDAEDDETKNKKLKTSSSSELNDTAAAAVDGDGDGDEDKKKQKQEQQEKEEEDFKTRIAHEIESLMNGTHPEFLAKCQMLDRVKLAKRQAAELYRDIQIQNLKNICEGEIKQANDDYENEVAQYRERLLNMLMDKQTRGENAPDANVYDYSSLEKTPPMATGGVSTRKLRKRRGDHQMDGASGMANGHNGSTASSTNQYQAVKFGYAAFDKYTKKRILPEELIIKSFSLSTDEINQDLNVISRKVGPTSRARQ